MIVATVDTDFTYLSVEVIPQNTYARVTRDPLDPKPKKQMPFTHFFSFFRKNLTKHI